MHVFVDGRVSHTHIHTYIRIHAYTHTHLYHIRTILKLSTKMYVYMKMCVYARVLCRYFKVGSKLMMFIVLGMFYIYVYMYYIYICLYNNIIGSKLMMLSDPHVVNCSYIHTHIYTYTILAQSSSS